MAAPAPTQSTRNCVACGRAIAWDANVCPYCGKDYRQPAPGMMPLAPPPKEKSAIPIVGGILILLSGIAGIVEGLMVILFALGLLAGFSLLPFGVFDLGTFVTTILLVIGLIPILLGVFAIMGGASAMGRKHYGMAILGGVCAMLILGPALITNIIGLVGLILIAVSHHEFD